MKKKIKNKQFRQNVLLYRYITLYNIQTNQSSDLNFSNIKIKLKNIFCLYINDIIFYYIFTSIHHDICIRI